MRAERISDEELGPLLAHNNYWRLLDDDGNVVQGAERVALPTGIKTRAAALVALRKTIDQISAGPTVEQLIAEVKQEASRRIDIVLPMWMVSRAVSGGKAIPKETTKFAEAIRQRSNELEAQIEAGEFDGNIYADDTWTDKPAKKGS